MITADKHFELLPEMDAQAGAAVAKHSASTREKILSMGMNA